MVGAVALAAVFLLRWSGMLTAQGTVQGVTQCITVGCACQSGADCGKEQSSGFAMTCVAGRCHPGAVACQSAAQCAACNGSCDGGFCNCGWGSPVSTGEPNCGSPCPVGNTCQPSGGQWSCLPTEGVTCTNGVCTGGPVCGNGIVEKPEICDDGNQRDDDACSGACLTPNLSAICSNGILDAGEQCDNYGSMGVQYDNSSLPSCAKDEMHVCNLANCTVTCQGGPPPTCGNGVQEATEECDDGNAVNGDGCSSSCKTEQNPACASLSPSGSWFISLLNWWYGCNQTPPVCGNGIPEQGEQCDDGDDRSKQYYNCDTCGMRCNESCQEIDPCVTAGGTNLQTRFARFLGQAGSKPPCPPPSPVFCCVKNTDPMQVSCNATAAGACTVGAAPFASEAACYTGCSESIQLCDTQSGIQETHTLAYPNNTKELLLASLNQIVPNRFDERSDCRIPVEDKGFCCAYRKQGQEQEDSLQCGLPPTALTYGSYMTRAQCENLNDGSMIKPSGLAFFPVMAGMTYRQAWDSCMDGCSAKLPVCDGTTGTVGQEQLHAGFPSTVDALLQKLNEGRTPPRYTAGPACKTVSPPPLPAHDLWCCPKGTQSASCTEVKAANAYRDAQGAVTCNPATFIAGKSFHATETGKAACAAFCGNSHVEAYRCDATGQPCSSILVREREFDPMKMIRKTGNPDEQARNSCNALCGHTPPPVHRRFCCYRKNADMTREYIGVQMAAGETCQTSRDPAQFTAVGKVDGWATESLAASACEAKAYCYDAPSNSCKKESARIGADGFVDASSPCENGKSGTFVSPSGGDAQAQAQCESLYAQAAACLDTGMAGCSTTASRCCASFEEYDSINRQFVRGGLTCETDRCCKVLDAPCTSSAQCCGSPSNGCHNWGNGYRCTDQIPCNQQTNAGCPAGRFCDSYAPHLSTLGVCRNCKRTGNSCITDKECCGSPSNTCQNYVNGFGTCAPKP